MRDLLQDISKKVTSEDLTDSFTGVVLIPKRENSSRVDIYYVFNSNIVPPLYDGAINERGNIVSNQIVKKYDKRFSDLKSMVLAGKGYVLDESSNVAIEIESIINIQNPDRKTYGWG